MNIKLFDTISGEKYKILIVTEDENLKQKLLDFGLIKGAVITPVFNSISKKSRGYEINDFVIGIRNCDAQKIIVSKYYGGSNNE